MKKKYYLVTSSVASDNSQMVNCTTYYDHVPTYKEIKDFNYQAAEKINLKPVGDICIFLYTRITKEEYDALRLSKAEEGKKDE